MKATLLSLHAGQTGKLFFNITAPEGEPTTLMGALAVKGKAVPMDTSVPGQVYIPPVAVGCHPYEIRCAGATVLHGELEVAPSPLGEQSGEVVWHVDADLTQPLAVVNIVQNPGPAGRDGKSPYVADGRLYYFDDTTGEWQDGGSVQGPPGADGKNGKDGVSPAPEDVAAALVPMISAKLSFEGPAGTYNWHANYFMLGEALLPQDAALYELGYRVRFDSLAGCTTDPVYLSVWEREANGEDWELRGVSLNTQVQAQSTDMMWQFDPAQVRLSGRPIRCCLMLSREDGWRTDLTMGMRTADVSAANTAIYLNEQTWQKAPKFFLTAYKPVDNIGFGGGGSVDDTGNVLGGNASGNLSLAVGGEASAPGERSVAIGSYAHAAGDGAIAIGDLSQASQADSVAIGKGAYVHADGSFAIGPGAGTRNSGEGVLRAVFSHIETTNGEFSGTEIKNSVSLKIVAPGSPASRSQLDGEAGLCYSANDGSWFYIKMAQLFKAADANEANTGYVLGGSAQFKGGCTATGLESVAQGPNSTATGYKAYAGESHSYETATATGSYSKAIDCGTATGGYAEATGNGSVATGHSAKATKGGAIAMGYCAEATGESGIAIGNSAKAKDSGAIAIGRNAEAENGECVISVGSGPYMAETTLKIVGRYSKVGSAQLNSKAGLGFRDGGSDYRYIKLEDLFNLADRANELLGLLK